MYGKFPVGVLVQRRISLHKLLKIIIVHNQLRVLCGNKYMHLVPCMITPPLSFCTRCHFVEERRQASPAINTSMCLINV